MSDFRTCVECDGAWFTLAPGEVEHGVVAGVVCLSTDNDVIAWSGVLVCHDCHKVADAAPPPLPSLVLVSPVLPEPEKETRQ